MKNLRKTLAVAVALATVSGAASAAGLKFDKADNRFSWDSLSKFESMDLSGKTIRFDGPWIDGDADNLLTVLAYFEEATGATVEYNGSNDFEQLVLVDMKAGNPPNLAAWPQPGTVAELAAQGNLAALPGSVEAAVKDSYAAGQSWVDLGTYAGADGKKSDVRSAVQRKPEITGVVRTRELRRSWLRNPTVYGRAYRTERQDRC